MMSAPTFPSGARPWREGVAVLVGGLLLGFALTAPAWSDPARTLIALPDSEVYAGAWVLDRAQRSFLEDLRPFAFVPEINWPNGRGLHALPAWEALLTLPLRAVAGPVLRYNLLCVLQVALAFAGAWVALRAEVRQRWAALPGAVAFASTPALLGALQSGPIETLGIGWLALGVWAVARAAPGAAAPGRGSAWLAGVLLAVNFWSNPYHFVFVACGGAFLVVRRTLAASAADPARLRELAVRAAICLGVGAVLSAPQAWAIHTSLQGAGAPWVHTADAELAARQFETEHVQDLLSFLLPSEAWYRPGPRWRVYVGLVLLGAASWGAWRARADRVERGAGRRGQGWLGVALGAALYAPGAWLMIGGAHAGGLGFAVPLPAQLLAHVPVFSSIHHPFRVVPLLVLALGALAAQGLDTLPAPRLARVSALLASAVLADQLAFGPLPVPLTATDVRVPAFYEELASDPDDYAVLDYLSAREPLNFGRPLLHAAWHRRRVLFDVRPPEAEWMRNTAVSLANWDPAQGPPPPIGPELCRDARALGSRGVRYLVKHRWDDAPDPREDALERCGFPVAREDAQVRAWRLDGGR